jgi:hypothetical protein
MAFNSAIDHVIQNNPKARQNTRGLSQHQESKTLRLATTVQEAGDMDRLAYRSEGYLRLDHDSRRSPIFHRHTGTDITTKSIKAWRITINALYLSLTGVYPMLTRLGVVASCERLNTSQGLGFRLNPAPQVFISGYELKLFTRVPPVSCLLLCDVAIDCLD